MKVSVVIPAYNRAHCIQNAINSVIAQTYPPKEIIIVDDGSTDNLQEIIDSYSASQLRLVKHQTNKGASQARNTGIEQAKGDYIAFLDSDDTWCPNKLEAQVAFMKQHNLEASCTNFAFYRNGTLEQESVYRPYKSIRLTQKDMAWGCFISPGSTFICKKELLTRICGYDTDFQRFEDWDLLFRLSQHCDIGWLNESLSIIYNQLHSSIESELQGLNLIKDKYAHKANSKEIKSIILSSYYFHRAAIDFKRKKYVSFIFHMVRSLIIQPFNNFPIKAIFIPQIFGK